MPPHATFTRVKKLVHCTLRDKRGALYFGSGSSERAALAVAKQVRDRSHDTGSHIPAARIPGWSR